MESLLSLTILFVLYTYISRSPYSKNYLTERLYSTAPSTSEPHTPVGPICYERAVAYRCIPRNTILSLFFLNK